jgi:hypothetical protein
MCSVEIAAVAGGGVMCFALECDIHELGWLMRFGKIVGTTRPQTAGPFAHTAKLERPITSAYDSTTVVLFAAQGFTAVPCYWLGA